MSEPIVDTCNGKIRGGITKSIVQGEFYAFKGIPYAKPPVGHLRFQDPVPAESWTGVRDAQNFGPICAQCDMILNIIDGTDDCLYLNVYVNSVQPQLRRPVMVWIHGGGFVVGSGNDSLYGPDYFLRKDIVFVTINYRVGVLGFLNLEDEVSPGNYGLKDQVQALQWVRDNIANFGGDPNNVTIFGESAGGASVHYLTLSPLAKGLFHKAIIQSGVAINNWAYQTNPTEMAYRMCDALGYKERDPKKIVDYLRTIGCQKLIEIQEQLLSDEEKQQFKFPFGPAPDPKSKNPFLPLHSEEAAEQGVQVPLLIGCNSREGIIYLKYMSKDLNLYNNNFEKYIHPHSLKLMLDKYGITSNELKKLYYKNNAITNENKENLIDLLGDLGFVEGIHRVVKIQVEKSSAPTYLYQYTYDKTLSPVKVILNVDIKGACHADELQHQFRAQLFETFNIPPQKQGSLVYKLMEQMTDMWVNFATTGRPTPTTTELIPLYWLPVTNETTLRYLDIGEDLRMEVTPNLEQRYSIYKTLKNKL